MIRTFACKETARIYNLERSTVLPPDIQEVARRKLKMLHAAACLRDLAVPPANRLDVVL